MSDSHFGHKNICKGVSTWEDKSGCRNFDTIEEMNKIIIDGINNIVKENDILYHNGDFSFGGVKNILEFRRRINCKEIHLTLGNHDLNILRNVIVDGIPVQELFTSVQHYKEISINKQKIILCHYSMRVWNEHHKNSIHLYGHSHSSLEKIPHGKSIDIGIDNSFKLFGEYRPFSLEEIIEIMNKRSIISLDHHI